MKLSIVATMALVLSFFSLPLLRAQSPGKQEPVRIYLAKTNSMGDLADVGRMANNLMQGVIVKVPYLQLVESSRLDELLAQQKHQQVFVRSEEAARAAQLSGAKWLILPDLLQAEGFYQFSIRIVGIETSLIPAIAQESFQERKEILARAVSCTEKLLQQFAQQQGLPPISTSAPSQQVQPPLNGQSATAQSAHADTPPPATTTHSDLAQLVAAIDSMQNTSDWSAHFLVRLGVGFNQLFQPSEGDLTDTITLTPAVQVGIRQTIGDYAFFIPYLRYRLNWGMRAASASPPSPDTRVDWDDDDKKIWSKSNPIAHQLALGFSLGAANAGAPNTFHSLMAGVGVDLYYRKVFQLKEDSYYSDGRYRQKLSYTHVTTAARILISPYIGYEVSTQNVGWALELGLGLRENEGPQVMIDSAVIFGWGHPTRKAMQVQPS